MKQYRTQIRDHLFCVKTTQIRDHLHEHLFCVKTTQIRDHLRAHLFCGNRTQKQPTHHERAVLKLNIMKKE